MFANPSLTYLQEKAEKHAKKQLRKANGEPDEESSDDEEEVKKKEDEAKLIAETQEMEEAARQALSTCSEKEKNRWWYTGYQEGMGKACRKGLGGKENSH